MRHNSTVAFCYQRVAFATGIKIRHLLLSGTGLFFSAWIVVPAPTRTLLTPSKVPPDFCITEERFRGILRAGRLLSFPALGAVFAPLPLRIISEPCRDATCRLSPHFFYIRYSRM